MRRALVLALAGVLAGIAAAPAWAPSFSRPDKTWVANGQANAIVRSGDAIYIGGGLRPAGGETPNPPRAPGGAAGPRPARDPDRGRILPAAPAPGGDGLRGRPLPLDRGRAPPQHRRNRRVHRRRHAVEPERERLCPD